MEKDYSKENEKFSKQQKMAEKDVAEMELKLDLALSQTVLVMKQKAYENFIISCSLIITYGERFRFLEYQILKL